MTTDKTTNVGSMEASRLGRAGLALLLVGCAGCGGYTQPDCVRPPCPLPLAIRLSVTSAAGGPVSGLTLTFSRVGVYLMQRRRIRDVVHRARDGRHLRAAADRLGVPRDDAHLAVQGSTPSCGCPSVTIEQRNVVVDPS